MASGTLIHGRNMALSQHPCQRAGLSPSQKRAPTARYAPRFSAVFSHSPKVTRCPQQPPPNDYNRVRPHGALGNQTSFEFAPCMANNPTGTKLGAASSGQNPNLRTGVIHGGSSCWWSVSVGAAVETPFTNFIRQSFRRFYLITGDEPLCRSTQP